MERAPRDEDGAAAPVRELRALRWGPVPSWAKEPKVGADAAIARRGTEHGSSLGIHRWVVERTFAWLHGFRRLRVRRERRTDIHEAFLRLACWLSRSMMLSGRLVVFPTS